MLYEQKWQLITDDKDAINNCVDGFDDDDDVYNDDDMYNDRKT